jgi:hypothetical protein
VVQAEWKGSFEQRLRLSEVVSAAKLGQAVGTIARYPWTHAGPIEDPQRPYFEFLAGAKPMSAIATKLAEGRETMNA